MSPLKTFIVEDSLVIRENLIAALEELTPVQVVGTAADEAAALLWLARADPAVALVIVDLFLDGGSGLGVLRALKGRAGAQRVVVLSNYATPDMQRKCLALGADRVFDKSSDLDALMLYCNRLGAEAVDGEDPHLPGPASGPAGHLAH